MIDTLSTIQDEEYIRRRLRPQVGDPDYIHLVDLIHGLSPFASNERAVILDYGCGGSPYRSLFPNADYRRADFQDTSDLDYVISDESIVGEVEGTFDLVLSTQVAEHVIHPSNYFAECLRLLKPGGQLICTTHGTYVDHGCPYDFQRWTADGLRRDLEFAGFSIIKIKKLSTNARALLYFMQRFSGWFDCGNGLIWPIVLRCFRSFLHRWPNFVHNMADKLFAHNRVVEAKEPGHDFYVGLIAVAEKESKP